MCPYRVAFREEATVLQMIHGWILEICDAQGKLSKVMEVMIEDLEGAKVQELT